MHIRLLIDFCLLVDDRTVAPPQRWMIMHHLWWTGVLKMAIYLSQVLASQILYMSVLACVMWPTCAEYILARYLVTNVSMFRCYMDTFVCRSVWYGDTLGLWVLPVFGLSDSCISMVTFALAAVNLCDTMLLLSIWTITSLWHTVYSYVFCLFGLAARLLVGHLS